MPGTFSLIAGGCLLDRVPDLPDSSKFRQELMSYRRYCWCCRIFAGFSEIILFFSSNGVFMVVCVCECLHTCAHLHLDMAWVSLLLENKSHTELKLRLLNLNRIACKLIVGISLMFKKKKALQRLRELLKVCLPLLRYSPVVPSHYASENSWSAEGRSCAVVSKVLDLESDTATFQLWLCSLEDS